MDLEEIENAYAQEVESAGKIFIAGIKEKKDVKVLEKEYKKRLKFSRDAYYKAVQTELKKKPKKQGKKKKKEEKTKALSIEKGEFELGRFARFKIKWHLAWFKCSFAFRNWRRRHTPAFLSFWYIKTKLTLKRWSARTSSAFERAGSKTKEFFVFITTSTSKGVKRVYTKLAALPEKIIEKLSKKKKKKDENVKGGADSPKEQEKDTEQKKEESSSSDQNK